MKRMVPMACLSIIMLLAGCGTFAGGTSAKPPTPDVTVGNQQVNVVQGSYCWASSGQGSCVDMVEPAKLAASEKAVTVPPGSKLSIHFSQAPKPGTLHVNTWTKANPEAPAQFDGETLTAPETPGTYIYVIDGQWDAGTSSYVLSLQVQMH